jgi:ubiquinone/menaquinone biosynthesis C-methylase UbiE
MTRRGGAAAGPRRWFFDAWSRVYDFPLVQRATYRPVQDAVVEALGRGAHTHVLDLGCGTGLLARRITETFRRASVVGCDFSAGMLRRAARCRAAHWVQGDAGRLPFTDGAFDAVVSTEAFHWFPDPAAALAEIFRVIKPGGRLLLAVVNTPAAPVSDAFHFGSRLVGEPFYWPTGGQLRGWIEAAGFRIDGQRRVFRLPGLLLPPVLTCAVRPAPGQRRRTGVSVQRGSIRTRRARAASRSSAG